MNKLHTLIYLLLTLKAIHFLSTIMVGKSVVTYSSSDVDFVTR